ncbi:putative F-box domain-containing protein [Rosellinia necatrix]|uniref:Putative F-box domain-containing protein n=1 Tax=Rosellinia necatrix TaxID=77044 RepID=A0A1S7UM22_ROSNE|nr:putative F-box domain-containing protein [Rosellinia necatrix]
MASPEPQSLPPLFPSPSPSPSLSSPPSPSSPSSPPPFVARDEKPPLALGQPASLAFASLPDEIVQHILQLTDPDSFASLVLLNSRWRRISQQAHLYAYHLSRCRSYAMSHVSRPAVSSSDDNLPNLRQLFAREVKRNLFEAYLRPKKTTIKLISNSISSSSAPGGEGMQFSPSPRGHHLLACNSSRIYVLDMRGPSLAVKRELKILRRPVSTCILDDGSFLAVLSTDMQVDLYDLTQTPPRRTQSLILDNTPRAMALSPCGRVLAAAYEGGIEVSSLNPGALASERRAVKCDGVDALAFSLDGTQLLGTTTTSTTPNTVILTAPYYDPGGQLATDDISALWTTSILFPNTSRDCSHAVLLQESSSMEAAWSFTYDRSFETFRAVRIDDLRNGTTYFTGPVPTVASPGPLLPCTLPAANYQGELVSAGFQGDQIWLYGVPEDLEAIPDAHHPVESSTLPALHRRSSGHSVRSPSRIQEADGYRVPQWQILCDKLRNTFISGRMIAESGGVSIVKWVSGVGESSIQERLIVASKGIVPHRQITEDEGIDFVDGGRITIFDFDYSPENGKEEEITIDVGIIEPEALEEEHRDIDTEVAIVRRRTVAQRRGHRGGVISTSTIVNRQTGALLRTSATEDDMEDPLIPRRMMIAREGSQPPAPDVLDDVSLEEAQEALDAPYTHASPRSGTTLRRAATAAAVNRQRNPPPPTAGHVEYRRADGRAEHPHESDADNWVPPPPPYSKEDPVVDLPSFLRHNSIPGVRAIAQNSSRPSDIPPVPPLPNVLPVPRVPLASITYTTNRPELPRIHTSSALKERPRQASEGSVVSQQTIGSVARGPDGEFVSRSNAFAQSTELRHEATDTEDIYGASPIGTPSPEGRTRCVSVITPEPDGLSAGDQFLVAEYTPASSRPLAVGEGASSGSIRSYEGIHNTPSTPATGPRLHDEAARGGDFDDFPILRRLPNVSTWPRAPDTQSFTPTSSLAGYPHSAPAINVNNEQLLALSLSLKVGSSESMDPHGDPDGASAPFPAVGSIPSSPVVARTHGGDNYSRRFSAFPQRRPPSPPQQPLIISTPTGVAGAFDAPQPGIVGNLQGPVLHAPVPRHPRPSPGNPLNQPTAERLETITGGGARTVPRVNPETIAAPPPPSSHFFMRHRTSVHRRPSRARRGALKNLQDARDRGWTGRKKKKTKDNDTVTTTGWTDVPLPSDRPSTQTKDKKCAVM